MLRFLLRTGTFQFLITPSKVFYKWHFCVRMFINVSLGICKESILFFSTHRTIFMRLTKSLYLQILDSLILHSGETHRTTGGQSAYNKNEYQYYST